VRSLEETVKALVASQKKLVQTTKHTAEQRPAIVIASTDEVLNYTTTGH
jgi:hypothetical protein